MPGAEIDSTPRLCEAIQDGRLRSALPELDRHDPHVRVVRTALEQIDHGVDAEKIRLAAAFDHSGVTSAVFDDGQPARPLRVVRVDVDRDEASSAVEAVEQLGYRRLAPTQGGAWHAYVMTHGGCALADVERGERRVELSWPIQKALASRFGRYLVPAASDFDATTLPERWWFGYIGVRLARLPLRAWQRRTEPAYLGPFLVTPDSLIPHLLEFAGVEPGQLVVDLGCGDARIPIAAANLGCRAQGVESDLDLVRLAREAVTAAGVNDLVEIIHADASGADITQADIVVMFLPVSTLSHLLPLVLERLRPGARLVVHEQERLPTRITPDESTPIATAEGITVAHRWNR